MATYKIDQSHSEVTFKVKHLMITTVTGYFKQFDLEVETQNDDFNTASRIEFTADINSIDTNNQQRDTHLKSADFFDAEKMIFSEKYNVAGTIDCLFKKENKDEYVMLDWKRSKKLIIDGRPRIFGYGYALSELNTLDNSSYNRYCLQQNIYKHIAETEYGMKISSMKLVVLHENYLDYHIVAVPTMTREASIILNSLKVKI